jgi:hypothetical protein
MTDDNLTTIRVLRGLSELYMTDKRYDDAEPHLTRALVALERTFGPDAPETLRCVKDLATLYTSQARHNEAALLLKRLQNSAGRDHKL